MVGGGAKIYYTLMMYQERGEKIAHRSPEDQIFRNTRKSYAEEDLWEG